MCFANIKNYDFSIKANSLDSQKLYEQFPNLFGVIWGELVFLIFVDHFWNQYPTPID